MVGVVAVEHGVDPLESGVNYILYKPSSTQPAYPLPRARCNIRVESIKPAVIRHSH